MSTLRKPYSNRQHVLRELRRKTEEVERREAERRKQLTKPKRAIVIIKHFNRNK